MKLTKIVSIEYNNKEEKKRAEESFETIKSYAEVKKPQLLLVKELIDCLFNTKLPYSPARPEKLLLGECVDLAQAVRKAQKKKWR